MGIPPYTNVPPGHGKPCPYMDIRNAAARELTLQGGLPTSRRKPADLHPSVSLAATFLGAAGGRCSSAEEVARSAGGVP